MKLKAKGPRGRLGSR